MMIELDAIFASDLSLAVFMYGSAVMFIASLAAAAWLTRSKDARLVGVPARA